MSTIPLPIGRVPNQMQSALTLATLQSSQVNLLKVQQQISTGKRLNQPSDDPAGMVGIMRLNHQIAANTQYTSNLNFAAGFLSQADSTLGQVSGLMTQAKSLANSMVGSTVTADQRKAEAEVINSILAQMMDLANVQYQGQSVFGGQIGDGIPFIAAAGGYKYVGTTQGQGILTPSGSSVQYTVNGNAVFGGESAEVVGYKTLTPALTSNTRLSDLVGAQLHGVAAGPVNVTVGATTVSVDLSEASSMGDVVSLLNAGLASLGSDAAVSFTGGSMVVIGDSTQGMTIADATNATTAADLGINVTLAANTAITGPGLGPKITNTTTLASLNNGAGVDTTGLLIRNGTSNATVSLAGLTTVEDFLNAINNSGTNVHAVINADGTGIDVHNPVSGSHLVIGENGGTTADDLGIRSFYTGTKVADLNAGGGISPISDSIPGPKGTIVVTRTDGTTFSFQADGITTTSQLINAINNATGNTTVTAALNATGNGISLTDTTAGTGNITVSGGSDFVSNGSTLGIFSSGAAGTLVGSNITFSTDDFRVTRKDGTSFTINMTGVVTIQDVLNKINNADGNTGANAVTASLNATGNGIQLSDASVGGGLLTVNSLSASPVAAELGILGSAPTTSPGVINGSDVNPIQPRGLFSSLVMLRNALLNNDTFAINRAAALLEEDGQRVIAANGVIGAREVDIQTRQDTVSTEQTQLQQSLSLVADTDMTSAVTQYQMLTTAYQAALQVAAKNQNLSLLDFLR